MSDRPDTPDQPGSEQPAAGSGPAPQDGPPSHGSPAPPPPPPYGEPAPYGEPPPAYGTPQYGSAPVYGAPQYGAPYGAYGPAGGPYPPSPEQQSIRTQAIISLVVNIGVVLFTCFSALPSIGGAVTAGIALGQVNSDPASARRLVKWSWGLLIASIVIGVLLVVGWVVFLISVGTAADTSSDSSFSFAFGS